MNDFTLSEIAVMQLAMSSGQYPVHDTDDARVRWTQKNLASAMSKLNRLKAEQEKQNEDD